MVWNKTPHFLIKGIRQYEIYCWWNLSNGNERYVQEYKSFQYKFLHFGWGVGPFEMYMKEFSPIHIKQLVNCRPDKQDYTQQDPYQNHEGGGRSWRWENQFEPKDSFTDAWRPTFSLFPPSLYSVLEIGWLQTACCKDSCRVMEGRQSYWWLKNRLKITVKI